LTLAPTYDLLYPTMKRICKKCGEEKDIEEFYKSKSWYRRECKRCVYIRGRKRVLKNIEKEATYQQNYRRKNKDHLSEYAKRYYQKNKERINKKNKRYAQTNKKKIAIYLKEYRKNNRDKYRASGEKYRMKPKNKKARSQKAKRYALNLTDGYIKNNLTQRSGIRPECITPQLIEAKRQYITLIRLIKEAKNELVNHGN